MAPSIKDPGAECQVGTEACKVALSEDLAAGWSALPVRNRRSAGAITAYYQNGLAR